MKKFLLAFFLFSFFSSASFSQSNQTKFQIIYNWGTTGNGFFTPSGTHNSVNGYMTMGWVFGGTSNLLPAGTVFETDTMGNVLWARRYRGDAFGFTPLLISDFVKSGTNYIMTGNRNNRAMLMKINANGSTINFSNTYSSNGSGNKLKEDGAGNIVVAGSTLGKTAMNPLKDSTSIYVF